jgi:hypothetical protein
LLAANSRRLYPPEDGRPREAQNLCDYLSTLAALDRLNCP